MVSNMTEQVYRVVTTGPCQVAGPDGRMVDVPVGSTINRVVSNPADGWVPPADTVLQQDDGTPIWTPPAPPVMQVDAYTWLQRLPASVQVSVATAAQKDPRLLVGMTLLSAAGTVDLTDPTGQLHSFLALAQAATAAMPDPLTAELVARMLAP
jgi:hypothetical protein